MESFHDGIDNVRACVLPDGIAANGRRVAVSHMALVTWRSCLEGLLYQVYVNGRFSGRTVDGAERRLVVPTPVCLESAVRIDVIAVRPRDADCDFGAELGEFRAGNARVKLTLLRSQSLPLEATMNVYGDGGSGAIDFAEPLNESPIPVWTCWQDKAGFGLARFGAGDFGYESAAAVGFGRGSFGNGLFGLDADVMEWISPILPPGIHRFAVKIVDASGVESSSSQTNPIAVVPPPTPASNLSILEFNERTGQLTLGISSD
jgi:hypothetical protein